MERKSNIDAHKKIHLKDVEKICCCFRGMKCQNDFLAYHFKNIDKPGTILDLMKIAASQQPEKLPDLLQAVEWEMGEIVKEAAQLLKEAGEAIDLLHNIRHLSKLMKP